MIYVCDLCGNYEKQDHIAGEVATWKCEVCGCEAAWEFPDERREQAIHHAGHVARLFATSGLRRTR